MARLAQLNVKNTEGYMWWKLLSVILIVYSIVAGMLVPLKPGITYVSPRQAQMGALVSLQVKGYNSSYAQSDPKEIGAWLKLDSVYAISAEAVHVKSDQELQIDFIMPNRFNNNEKVRTLTLVLDNPIDGVSLLPSAVIARSTDAPSLSTQNWEPAIITGLHAIDQMRFPYRNILNETIRNLYYHVPLWFGMLIILAIAAYCSVRYLEKREERYDYWASSLTTVGVLYGVLGLVTGAIWANYTWGAPWSWDVKQNMSAIAILMYFGYFLLRSAQDDEDRKNRISAIFNVFAFVCLIPLLFVIPRLVDSLHPGNGGNPALGSADLDSTMRMIFYPAIIGFTLFGLWISQILYRIKKISE